MEPDFDLPLKKQNSIVEEFGESGKIWVANYQVLLAECLTRWHLTPIEMAQEGLPINVVIFCEDENARPVVLKMGHPHPEQKTELVTLREYEGRNAVELIDWDDASGAFLMHQILPGKKFRDCGQDIERSRLSITLFDELPREVVKISGLPFFNEWLSVAFKEFRAAPNCDPEYLSFIELAETLYAKLVQDHPKTYLLHGDLHHENILLDEDRGWIAIDPKGVIGPKLMECGRYLHNVMEDEIAGVDKIDEASEPQLLEIFEARFLALGKIMQADYEEIVAVAYIDLVLSSCWSINSGQVVGYGRLRVLKRLMEQSRPELA
jgi:streptomycin 6-kinase